MNAVSENGLRPEKSSTAPALTVCDCQAQNEAPEVKSCADSPPPKEQNFVPEVG